MRIGTARIEKIPLDRPPAWPISTELASRKPTNIDPQSPIKIDDGTLKERAGKLLRKKS
jgi:hypothetical protein